MFLEVSLIENENTIRSGTKRHQETPNKIQIKSTHKKRKILRKTALKKNSGLQCQS